jgi:hypothetical protein
MLRSSSGTAPTVEIGAGVRVTISPVTASPELQPEEIALLDRFFRALWIEMHNGTSSSVLVDPAGALIFDRSGTPWVALDSAQREEELRWQPWSWRSWLARWMWAGRIKRVMKKLDRLQLESGPLDAGGERRGLLVFKAIPTPMCGRAELEWTLARVEHDPAVSTVTHPAVLPVRMAMAC